MNVAIIPARGGSKRIPRKNVKLFAGLPMIAHTIRAAQNSGVFDRIIVSTDDDEIAAIAQQHGAEVPFRRPAELANDFAGTDAVLQHALGWLRENGGLPEYFCCLYATAPLMRASDIRGGLAKLKTAAATTAYTVTTFPYTIFRALRVNERGRMEMIWPENFPKRSQDFPEAIHDAGQFYWCDTVKYLVAKRLLTDDTLPIPIPRQRVQDIDTPEDWDVAEQIFQMLEKSAAEVSRDWKSPKLFIRADASSKMGTGHVMRMLALAQAWRRKGGDAVFICAQIPDALATRVRNEGFEVVPFPNVTSQTDDAGATLEAIQSHGSSSETWVAADGYHFGENFQRAIKAAGHRLLVMDDNGENAAYRCDIALNQNLSARAEAYAVRDASTLLLGTDYTLLRAEFLGAARAPRSFAGRAGKVLVTLGGADPDNVTGRVIAALAGCHAAVTVVVGAGNPHLENLKSQISNLGFKLVVNATNMPELIAGADLAITAGGSTCWEMCLSGLPMIVLCIAENQRGIVRGLGAAGAALDAGDAAELDAEKLRDLFRTAVEDAALRGRLSAAARALVDGRGADRVVAAMLGVAGAKP